ncbi:hypothetical protein Rsub_11815 [Raphidocelis subcapitata]|uniref:Uncharacterized protein n=1 Tax=Raphidocelis subcapitata TaxID=307507 RepID=A0A2V0PGQ9_9CHLO|nr:hypothetical protein Rsub_11815 [Raphidocelis subcapitata]|eukprot:GBF99011.1 hypothetical protein Rsub_11815 [Raphidocelis subcapitata]
MPRSYPLLHVLEDEPAADEAAPAAPGPGAGAGAGGDAPPARSPVYVAEYAKGGIEALPGVTTCYELWDRAVREFPGNDALAWRERGPDGKFGPYQSMTYAEAGAQSAAAAAGLKALGLERGDRVGICAVNSPEWMISMQAANRMGYVAVPLYDTLGEDAVAYVVGHAEVRVVLCGASKLADVAQIASRPAPAAGAARRLEAIIYWGRPSEAARAAAEAAAARVAEWGELLAAGAAAGAAAPAAAEPPAPGDLCTIMYTSGTTGNPKGVMITHASVLSEVSAIRQFFHRTAGVAKTDAAMRRYFSFLTLAHIFDRVVEEAVIMQGGCVGYFTGDVRRILEDVAVFKPTGFAGVPRVFDRIYAGAMAKVRGLPPLRRFVFHAALAWKRALIRLGRRPESASRLADALVFNKFKAALGGQCQAIISGGAPLAPRVQEFVQIAMCCPVIQGYGLTESCAASFVTLPWNPKQLGTVGLPIPGVQVRLEAVPELGYSPLADVARGEVCLRGPAMFSGYYKQPELTAEVVDADGFFHTGDIGEFTPAAGLLKIIDRKKNIFKLAQGEYIAVEAVEAALGRCPLVEQVWVYGNSFESALVAVVVPLRERLEEWARTAGLLPAQSGTQSGAQNGTQSGAQNGTQSGGQSGPDEEEAAGAAYRGVLALGEAQEQVLAALTAAGRAAKLKGFELPRAVHLEWEPFSVENGLVTPKFSLKRPQLLAHYKKQVDAMYSALKTA